jgi:hypothetical protein
LRALAVLLRVLPALDHPGLVVGDTGEEQRVRDAARRGAGLDRVADRALLVEREQRDLLFLVGLGRLGRGASGEAERRGERRRTRDLVMWIRHGCCLLRDGGAI